MTGTVLELLPEMISRYSLEVHAYMLMSNHYHPVIGIVTGPLAGIASAAFLLGENTAGAEPLRITARNRTEGPSTHVRTSLTTKKPPRLTSYA